MITRILNFDNIYYYHPPLSLRISLIGIHMTGYIFCHLTIKSMYLLIIIEYIFSQFAKYLFPKDQQTYPKNGISLIIYIIV